MALLEAGEAVSNGRLLRPVVLPVGLALAVIAVWQILCHALHIPPVLLPPPSDVWTVLHDNYAILLDEALPTLNESIVSFIVASVLGVALGALVAHYLVGL